MRSTEILTILVVCVFASGTATPKRIFYFPTKAAEVMVEGTIKCISKLGIDPAVINQLKEGKYAEDERMVEALLCMMQDIGIGHEDGRTNVDKIMHDMFADDPQIRDVMEGCDKDYGKTPVLNLKSFFMCFRDAAPFKIMFA